MIGHVGERWLAYGMTVEEVHNSLYLNNHYKNYLREQEVMKQGSDEFISFKQFLVEFNIAAIPCNTICNTLKNHS